MATLALAAADRHGALPALRSKRDGRWHDIRFAELGERVRGIARGLVALGVEPGDRVAIRADTRPAWTCADLAALAAGATVVPIYPNATGDETAYLVEHSGARLAFCDTAERARDLRAHGSLEWIVAFDGDAGEMPLDELVEGGARVDREVVDARAAAVAPDDLCTLVYTSGTTGRPKGCMLLHRNVRANLDMIEAVVPAGARPVLFAFLPLAHALTRTLQMYAVDVGGTLAYWDGERATLLADLAAVRPTQLPSVPRMYEKIYAMIEAGLEEASPVKRRVFAFAVGTGKEVAERKRRGARVGAALRVRHALADRLALAKLRDAFGGRLEIASTGAAPMDPAVLEFFHAAGIPLMEGYGLTECTAVATINTPGALRIGSVGRPLPGSELLLAEDGEVLIRGPHVFAGYYRDEEATRAVLDDGWLRSGDLGEIDDAGFLTIVGRKKDIIVTASGKNVAPARIEDALRRHRWLSQAVVYGDRRPYLVALLTLDPEEAGALARRVGAPAGPALADHPGVRAELAAVVGDVNRGLPRSEQVKRFAILDADLSQEAGELTPTLKVRRAAVHERHADVLDALYAGGGTEPADGERAQFPSADERGLLSASAVDGGGMR